MICPHCQHEILALTAIGLIKCEHCAFLPTMLFKNNEIDRTVSYRRYEIDERGPLSYKFVYILANQMLEIYQLHADVRAEKIGSIKLTDPSYPYMEKAILTALKNPAFL